MEVMFYIIAGKFNPPNDDAPEVFIERYRNYKLDLMDKTHIDKIAQ